MPIESCYNMNKRHGIINGTTGHKFLKGGFQIMSNREIATTIFNDFTDEQINAFILLFADENTKARLETEAILADPNSKRFHSFDEVMEDIFLMNQMYDISYSTAFHKDLKRLKKRGYDLQSVSLNKKISGDFRLRISPLILSQFKFFRNTAPHKSDFPWNVPSRRECPWYRLFSQTMPRAFQRFVSADYRKILHVILFFMIAIEMNNTQ